MRFFWAVIESFALEVRMVEQLLLKLIGAETLKRILDQQMQNQV